MKFLITITADEPAAFLAVLRKAVAYRWATPKGWRPSEVAMTKAGAQQALDRLQGDGPTWSLSLFDWCLLKDECARAHLWGQFPEAWGAYSIIRTALLDDPRSRAALARADAVDKAQQHLKKANAALERARRQAAEAVAASRENLRQAYRAARREAP